MQCYSLGSPQLPTTVLQSSLRAGLCVPVPTGDTVPLPLCVAAGATAFVSETGLGIDRLRVCNLSSTAFSGCQDFSGFGLSGLRTAFASGHTVW